MKLDIKKLSKFYKDKKILVTGHSGFKGSWMCIILNLLAPKFMVFL